MNKEQFNHILDQVEAEQLLCDPKGMPNYIPTLVRIVGGYVSYIYSTNNIEYIQDLKNELEKVEHNTLDILMVSDDWNGFDTPIGQLQSDYME